MSVRATAAISVAALLSASMLFGNIPYGGVGLPQNVYGSHQSNAGSYYAAAAAAAAAGSPHAPMVVQNGFRPAPVPPASPALFEAHQQQFHHQQKFLKQTTTETEITQNLLLEYFMSSLAYLEQPRSKLLGVSQKRT